MFQHLIHFWLNKKFILLVLFEVGTKRCTAQRGALQRQSLRTLIQKAKIIHELAQFYHIIFQVKIFNISAVLLLFPQCSPVSCVHTCYFHLLVYFSLLFTDLRSVIRFFEIAMRWADHRLVIWICAHFILTASVCFGIVLSSRPMLFSEWLLSGRTSFCFLLKSAEKIM